jgi:hypothetical protein
MKRIFTTIYLLFQRLTRHSGSDTLLLSGAMILLVSLVGVVIWDASVFYRVNFVRREQPTTSASSTVLSEEKLDRALELLDARQLAYDALLENPDAAVLSDDIDSEEHIPFDTIRINE